MTEKAMVAFDMQKDGVVLYVKGDILEQECSEYSCHLEENVLGEGNDLPESGIWVWEGTLVMGNIMGDEAPTIIKSEWRRPTEEEWTALKQGKSPWQ